MSVTQSTMRCFRLLIAAVFLQMIAAQYNPTIRSITSDCGQAGCFSGTSITIIGTNLIDDQSYVAVELAPNFWSTPAYQAYDCPVSFDQSSQTMVLCTLPVVPSSYTGTSLVVNLTNAYGGVLSYTSFVTYSPVIPPLPIVQSVGAQSGCTQINGSALDACGISGSFYVYGLNFQVDSTVTSLDVALSNARMTNFLSCPYYDTLQTTLICTFPANIGWDYGSWYSVSVTVNGTWSDPLMPGIRLSELPTGPNVLSVNSACPSSGCYSSIWLTIGGTNLIDSTGFSSIQLAPTFWSSPPYEEFDCPVDLDFSTETLMYCTLPAVSSDYLGINLMLQVTTNDGTGVITGGVTYALPSSTGSDGSSSSGWQPVPPPQPSDSSSYHASFYVAQWISLTVPIVLIIALVCCLAARRRRRLRRLAVLNLGAAPAYVAIDNQPLNAPVTAPVAAPVAAHVETPVVAAAPAYPSVYAYHYPQQPVQYYQYPGAQFQPFYQPAAQYQGPLYHQPSAPSAYPNVHQYQAI